MIITLIIRSTAHGRSPSNRERPPSEGAAGAQPGVEPGTGRDRRRASPTNHSRGNGGFATDRPRTQKTSERVALDIVHDIVGAGPAHRATACRSRPRWSSSTASAGPRCGRRCGCSRCRACIPLKPGPGGGPVVGHRRAANLARTASLYFHLSAATYGQLIETQVLLEPICAQLAAQASGPPRARWRRSSSRSSPENRGRVPRQSPSASTTPSTRLADNPVLTLLTAGRAPTS